MADTFPIPTHKRFKDLRGQVFTRWTVLSYAGMHPKNGAMWNCRCECGTTRAILGKYLWTSKSQSCGCYSSDVTTARNLKHGFAHRKAKTPEYETWERMRGRCLNPTNPRFHYYGGRGITICDRWLESFENFLADMGTRPSPKHSIDRIDNDGHYEPTNCRWALPEVQQNNRRPRNSVVRDRRLRNI